MSKKIDWTSEPELTGSMSVTGLPSEPVLVTDEGNVPGCSVENVLKKTPARSDALGCGVAGLFLIQSLTTASWLLTHSSTYAEWVGSPVTQACAMLLCASAHCETMCGLPPNLSPCNHASTSGATGLSFLSPAA